MNLKSESGYTLISLIGMIAVSAIFMTALAQTWYYRVTLDREQELIFRGESYKFAIELYQKKYSKPPTKLSELTKYHFIRKLYTDPVMDDIDFELILQDGGGKKRESELSKSQRQSLRGEAPGGSSLGIIGVVSLSDATALRPYNEKEKYNEWEFVAGEGKDKEGQQGEGGDKKDGDPRSPGAGNGGR